jgi:Ca-activated chloride channel family protein
MFFQWPAMLWTLLAIPLLIALYILAQRRRRRYALRYASLSLVKEALGRGPGWRRHLPPALFAVGLTLMLVALARPMSVVTLPSDEGTVILTMDVSGSMRADDLKPSRLDAAKAAARSFIEKQPSGVKIGVVSFSDNAFLVQAPTTDKEAVTASINRLTPQRGTAIGSALLTSLDSLFEDAFTEGSAPLSPNQPTPTPKSIRPPL